MELIFRQPTGRRDPVADIEDVLRPIREAGRDYWNAGSGDAGLVRRDGADQRRLSFYFLGDHGFHLVYYGGDDYQLAALPEQPPARPKWVTLLVGGNRMKLNTGQAVSRREADEIVRRFAADGTRDPGHVWAQADWGYVE